jgi:phage-related tail fiber protein
MSDPVRGAIFKPGEECKRSGIYRVIPNTIKNTKSLACTGSRSHHAITVVTTFVLFWNAGPSILTCHTGGLLRRGSMVVHLEANGLEARFWPINKPR